ncbi:two component transcriptional regulator winged helix family [Candidatus Rickettsiella viridis]|uniref:Two component transcriptional regulator winged helix family n=1 Tax=Candidatus Rickettsiella viridis TaxID=676208 RepID=A0A2Z5UVQ0_9COXI|nr:response regulator [Candidatus Rickettsiella viridis]BBB15135.1 two component transcriptional regulator winged helix family [Candidatus Rickettsiella viridis]
MKVEQQEQQEIIENHQIIKEALVVEDDNICEYLLCNYLSNLDYRVEVANKASAAIQLIQSKPYTLIITDLGLPDQSGEAVIQAARMCELNQATPLIVCSAHGDLQAKKYLDLGADKVLVKPILEKNLVEVMEKCFLVPGYQRKFYYQFKILLKQLKELIEGKEQLFFSELEIDDFIQSLRHITQKSTQIRDEYQQWAKKLGSKEMISFSF